MLTPFGKLFDSGTVKGALSQNYLILVAQDQALDLTRKAWEKALMKESSEEQWCRIRSQMSV